MSDDTKTGAEAAVESLYRDLMIDPKWAFWQDGGFSWWSYRLVQHVMLGDPFEAPGGESGYPIHIWTDVVGDVDDGDAALDAVASANLYESMDLGAGTANHPRRIVGGRLRGHRRRLGWMMPVVPRVWARCSWVGSSGEHTGYQEATNRSSTPGVRTVSPRHRWLVCHRRHRVNGDRVWVRVIRNWGSPIRPLGPLVGLNGAHELE